MDLQRGVYIDGATEEIVNSDIEMLKLIERGSMKRYVSGLSNVLE